MKKLMSLAWAFMLLSSCALPSSPAAAPSADAVPVHYMRGVNVVTEQHDVSGESMLQRVNALLDAMRAPADAALQPLAPRGLAAVRVIINFNTATVDFSEQYNRLSDLSRALLCTAISQSMFVFADVNYVRFSCLGEFLGPVADRYFDAQTVMLDDSLIRFNAWEVVLYFPTAKHNGLTAAETTVKAEERELSPALLLAQLMQGVGSNLVPFRGAVKTYTLTVRGALCLVDLTPSPNTGFPLGQPADVYAIVNTLCSLGNIERVKITISGRAPSIYGISDCDGELVFNQSLLR